MIERETLKRLQSIEQTLSDKKGFNILVLDVKGLSTLTDYFVIAEGTVDRHVSSLGSAVIQVMQENGEKPQHAEGLKLGDWVVLDYFDIVVHIFLPLMRDNYRLEHLWREGKIVDLKHEVV